VAPESTGVLARYLSLAAAGRVTLLGPGPRAARLAGDKLATLQLLERAGVPVPSFTRLPMSCADRLRRRRLPFVLKPRDGCGSEGVSIVRSRAEILPALRRARAATRRRDLLVEEHIPGIPASVSLLVVPGTSRRKSTLAHGARIRVLALGRQRLEGRSALRYVGGVVPWRPARRREAVASALRAIVALQRATKDVRGFVGVDLVLGADGPRILEINPRLTSSYLGLRRVLSPDPGRLLCAVLPALRPRGPVRCGAPVRFDASGRVRAAALRRLPARRPTARRPRAPRR
jgi:predicted ATP-grasp superfamily ATP-dependent carboligase